MFYNNKSQIKTKKKRNKKENEKQNFLNNNTGLVNWTWRILWPRKKNENKSCHSFLLALGLYGLQSEAEEMKSNVKYSPENSKSYYNHMHIIANENLLHGYIEKKNQTKYNTQTYSR